MRSKEVWWGTGSGNKVTEVMLKGLLNLGNRIQEDAATVSKGIAGFGGKDKSVTG